VIELGERLDAEAQPQGVLAAAIGGLALIFDADGASVWLCSPAGAWEGHLAAPLSANPDQLATQFDAAPIAGQALLHLPGERGGSPCWSGARRGPTTCCWPCDAPTRAGRPTTPAGSCSRPTP